MAVAITMLAQPGSPACGSVEGGSLVEGTTYYYVIVPVSQLNASVVQTGFWGLPSAEVSRAPAGTKLTNALSWSAVVGANGYAIYRSLVSGDYRPGDPYTGTAHFLVFTALTSYNDTGGTALTKVVYYPDGCPKIAITGGTEGTPNTEVAVYNALVAGGYTNLYARQTDGYGKYATYYFVGHLYIDGAFRITAMTTVNLWGYWSSTANGIFLLGIQNNGPQSGAVLHRTGPYYSTQIQGTLKWYCSRIADEGYVLYNGNINVRYGQICYTAAVVTLEDCQLDGFGMEETGNSSGQILDTYAVRGQNLHTSVIAQIRNDNAGIELYSYYSNPASYGNPWSRGVIGKYWDMQFHTAYTATWHAFNHVFALDPPAGYSISNPAQFTVMRCYDGFIKCIDISGNTVAGVLIILQDALGNTLAPEVSDSNGFVFVSSGTATSGSSTTLVDNTKTVATDTLVDQLIEIYEGTGVGQIRSIKANNNTGTITIKGRWVTNPAAGSKYRIKARLDYCKYVGKASGYPYMYDTIMMAPWTLRAYKSGYQITEMRITPTSEYFIPVIMRLNAIAGQGQLVT